MNSVTPPSTVPQIVIKRHGAMFVMTPPTTAFAQMLKGPEAQMHSQQVFATFEKALGFAVGLAAPYDWTIVDQTETVAPEEIAMLIAAHKAGLL